MLHESRRHPASLVGGVSSYEPDLGEALLCVGKATEKLATDHQVADRAVDESQMVPDLPPLRREALLLLLGERGDGRGAPSERAT